VKEEGSPPRKPAGVKAESEEGNSENKQKFKFADLFKDEGMYHSVSEAPVMKVLKKGSGGLIRTPLQELERYEIEQELREVEHDREYNQQLFDPVAMREIQLRN
jgi:hypothetical protein